MRAPVMMISRTPKQTLELCGVTIDPGDHVGVNLVAANRDPRMFDEPDRFDMHRGTKNHSAFGLGPHICLGQHLARMEMRIMMEELLPRLKKLELAGEPARVESVFVGGLKRLPIRFEAA